MERDQRPRHGLPGRPHPGVDGERARSAGPGVPSVLQQQRALLHLLHGGRRRPDDRRVPRDAGLERGRSRRGPGHPIDQPPRLEPQRRHAGLRTRRLSLRVHGRRRRQLGRPRGRRAEPQHAPGEDPALRRGRALPHPRLESVRRRQSRDARRDLGLRTAQSVALQLRPAQRGPLHRRRRQRPAGRRSIASRRTTPVEPTTAGTSSRGTRASTGPRAARPGDADSPTTRPRSSSRGTVPTARSRAAIAIAAAAPPPSSARTSSATTAPG